MRINSFDKSVGQVLQLGFFEIPRFQRPYSWDKENINDFWNDVIVDKNGEYFIGSMVVFHKKAEENYKIVDGQQRTTTITMILCALRDAFKAEGYDNLANGVHQFVEKKNIEYKDQFILMTETSYPYFQNYIQKHGVADIKIIPGEEEKNIAQAYGTIKEYITAAIDSIKSDSTISDEVKKEKIKTKLLEIRDIILGLKLIFIELDSEDDAYIIFETLNTRGKDLSTADLVKNHLGKYIKSANPTTDIVKIEWTKVVSIIENLPGEISIDEFLFHFWLSKYNFITAKKLFKSIRKTFKTEKDVRILLKELVANAEYYRDIYTPESVKWNIEGKAISDSLKALLVFNIKQPLPAILALLRCYRRKHISIKQIITTLKLIERFHFQFTAVTSQRSSGSISVMYATMARELSDCTNESGKNRIIRRLKDTMVNKLPSLEQFEAGFSEIAYTNKLVKQKKLTQYILSRLHAHFQPKGTVADYSNMSIEHILSQSQKHIDDSVVGKLGNLIYVSQELNEALKTKSFFEKKQILQKHGYVLDDILARENTWGVKQIENRTKYLAQIAFEMIWKV